MYSDEEAKSYRGNQRQHHGVEKPKSQKPSTGGMEHGAMHGKHGHSIHRAEGGGFHHTLHHEDGTHDQHMHDNYDEAEQHGREHMGETQNEDEAMGMGEASRVSDGAF